MCYNSNIAVITTQNLFELLSSFIYILVCFVFDGIILVQSRQQLVNISKGIKRRKLILICLRQLFDEIVPIWHVALKILEFGFKFFNC